MATLRKKYHELGNKINNSLLFIGSVKKDLMKRQDAALEQSIKDCGVAEQEMLAMARELDVIKSITYRHINPDRNVTDIVEESQVNNKDIKILFVDDEAQLCDLLERSYLSKGFQVEVAVNVADAKKKIVEYAPHILVLDLYLETGMEGVDILRFVKMVMPQIKCLIVSREFDEDRLKEIKELGVEGILKKPVMADELEAKINAVAIALG